MPTLLLCDRLPMFMAVEKFQKSSSDIEVGGGAMFVWEKSMAIGKIG